MLHKLPRFLSYLLPRTTHKEPIAHNFLDARGSVAEKWREFCSIGLLSGVLPPSADDFLKHSFYSASSSATSRWSPKMDR